MTQARFAHGTQCNIDYTPGTAVTAGDVVIQGGLIGIALRAMAANVLNSLSITGVFDIVKANGAWTAGQDIYWNPIGDPQGGDAGSGAATTTATAYYLGRAVEAEGATDTTGRVALAGPTAQAGQGALANVIADPGDAGAIPVTDSGSVSLVSAGAETRTLADPTFVGQQLSIGLKTDGGDVVITSASPVNQTGNNTLTMADVGDHIQLSAIEDGADIEWRVVANDGVALSTV